uniref:Uncharacterized protein n=1 Tax=Plectus sambesii TaxID=2011161 RepID=A0A914XJH9_9BILA
MQQRMEQRKAEVDQKIAAMSPKARNAAMQMKSLWMEHAAKMEQIKAGLSESEKAELESLHGGHGRWGGRGGPMGGGPMGGGPMGGGPMGGPPMGDGPMGPGPMGSGLGGLSSNGGSMGSMMGTNPGMSASSSG